MTKNLPHSCGQHSIDEHFEGKEPVVRRIFDALVGRVRECGEVTVYAQKSRIVFMVAVRFAAVSTRKNALIGHLWMERAASHAAVVRSEVLGARSVLNHFRFTEPSQIDEAFSALIEEAYSSHNNV